MGSNFKKLMKSQAKLEGCLVEYFSRFGKCSRFQTSYKESETRNPNKK